MMEFLFNCIDIIGSIHKYIFYIKNTPLSNKNMIYEEFNVRYRMTKFCEAQPNFTILIEGSLLFKKQQY